MNIFIKLSFVLLALMAESCESTKVATEANAETKEQSTQQMKQDLSNEGFSSGVVKYLKGSKCPYIIVDDKTGAQFDPINMDDETFANYKKDQEKVYYKYRPLRRMNRCNEAQPIELEDIKKRED